jgi:hypothetical protein
MTSPRLSLGFPVMEPKKPRPSPVTGAFSCPPTNGRTRNPRTRGLSGQGSRLSRRRGPKKECAGYTALPTIAPMPAVTAIARAPQNTTRTIGLKTSAPPVFAPIMPSKARKAKEPIETTGRSHVDGETIARTSGPAAPRENEAADASAACSDALRLFRKFQVHPGHVQPMRPWPLAVQQLDVQDAA